MKAPVPIKRLRRGATTMEYMAILALIVIPLAAMFPILVRMLKVYGARVVSLVGLPFP
jgi:hypothetical protein